MGNIETPKYINNIGIKKELLTTPLGNSFYILNNGQKYKQFGEDYRNLNEPENFSFFESLKKQTEFYNHPLISFPQTIICDNNTLFGYIADYEVGSPLSNLDITTQIDYLLYLLEQLENGIADISYKGWYIEDLHDDNILINNDQSIIRIIDSDFYEYKEHKDRLLIYRHNLKLVFNTIINSIIPNLKISNIWNDKEIKFYYKQSIEGILKISEFLKLLLLKLKIISNENIATLRKSL